MLTFLALGVTIGKLVLFFLIRPEESCLNYRIEEISLTPKAVVFVDTLPTTNHSMSDSTRAWDSAGLNVQAPKICVLQKSNMVGSYTESESARKMIETGAMKFLASVNILVRGKCVFDKSI